MKQTIEEVTRRSAAGKKAGPSRLDAGDVRSAYARWAPIYDPLFGRALRSARRETIALVNELPAGRVLECGVGTGISLPDYRPDHRITGIDLSPEMLAIARSRVAGRGLANVEELQEADAAALPMEPGAFDISVAMFVLTVVPDPRAVMAELARVTRKDGTVLIVSNLPDRTGWRRWTGDRLAPFSASLGWHTDFRTEILFENKSLRLVDRRRVGPLGFFTLLTFTRS